MTKWCPFCLFFFCKDENDFFRFSRRQDWSTVSASYMLRFACTGGNALLQASVYFIPNRSHCCTEGIFLFVQSNHTQRNANVQIAISCGNGTNTRPAGTVVLLILEIWVLTFLPVYLDKSRDFLCSFKSLFRPYPGPAVLTEVGGQKNPSDY